MITLGIDFAAEPKGTALATVEWHGGVAAVTGLSLGADDDAVVTAVRSARIAGVDCPFGWPLPFVDMIDAHSRRGLVAPESSGRPWRRHLALRTTDLAVQEITGITPLSVSADRIGHAAMRWAAVMARLGASGVDCARDGTGRLAEVYPAAALKIWGMPYRGYKRSDGAVTRSELVTELRAEAPWLDFGRFLDECRESDDALDAVISAVIARAVIGGSTRKPMDRNNALIEGWIHLPTVKLSALGGPATKPA